MGRSPDDFDLMDPVVLADPFEAYDVLRRQAPVYEMPGSGLFVVTSYEGIDAALSDPATFSRPPGSRRVDLFRSEEARDLVEQQGFASNGDPPGEDLRRALAECTFGPERMLRAEPFIRAIVEDRLLTLGSGGACEFVSEFCVPLPLIVSADRLGLGLEDLPRLQRGSEAWLRPFGFGTSPEQDLELAAQIVDLQQVLAGELEKRRGAPRDDLLSDLVNGRVSGAGLETAQALAILEPLLIGGNETVTNALASAMWLLLEHPEVLAVLRADPSRIPAFIEEALRLESPVQGVMRRATRDADLLGVKIPKDRLVHLRLGAANRDPAVFPDPHRLELERDDANPHLAFARGVACPGAALARFEMGLAFEMLLAHWEEISPAVPQAAPEYLPSFSLRALRALPLDFRARR